MSDSLPPPQTAEKKEKEKEKKKGGVRAALDSLLAALGLGGTKAVADRAKQEGLEAGADKAKDLAAEAKKPAEGS